MIAFKYASQRMDKWIGGLWLFSGLLHLILSLFILISWGIDAIGVSVFSFILSGVQFFLGRFYFTLDKRNYILVESGGMIIDRGLILRENVLPFEEIKSVKDLSNEFRIILISGKEFRIKKVALTGDDVHKVEAILKEGQWL